MNLSAHFAAVFLALCLPCCCSGQDAVAASSAAVVPDGSVLALGDSCYTITSKQDGAERSVGAVFQRIQRQDMNGVDVLAVIVHQHLSSGKFDMRDSFLLRRKDLRPIRLDTERNGAPHVHLDYAAHRISGWKMVNGVKEPIDLALDGPVWDGNLWGVTFAALPLKAGGDYRIPTYQYDSGKGTFLVTVKETRKIEIPTGVADAWVLEAGLKADERVEYLVGKNPPRDLGYLAGPMSQHIGGDCSGIH
ncbi:DUF3108 domain-containing protein [Terriglobus tenax]|uniref:DUF3108 domain-containing protein n=1 Tax=Terriglobus tenax TaxID=1111115 RepID=UPI0021DF9F91|nr:hypothetical protein [Terriglobus tenax]